MKISTKKIFLIVVFIVVISVSLAPFVYAQETSVTLLAPIDKFIGADEAGDLGGYLSGLFNLVIAVTIGLSVVMIAWGGIQYMITGNFSKKEEGREFIQSALTGLFIAIAAFLLLQTINPDLVEFDIVRTLERAQTSIGEATGRGSFDEEEEVVVRERLAEAGIGWNAEAPQTILSGLPENAIEGLTTLKFQCDCEIVVTGGSEYGHLTHGPGKPIVDLRPNARLNNFIARNVPIEHGTRVSTPGFAVFVFEEEGVGNSTGDHWHVVFR